jgi:hypothetical protein
LIGAALVLGAFRHGPFLEIESLNGSRKRLAFKRDTDPAELDAFLRGVETQYAVRIEGDDFALGSSPS